MFTSKLLFKIGLITICIGLFALNATADLVTAPSHVTVRATQGGQVMISWALPEYVRDAGLTDAASDRVVTRAETPPVGRDEEISLPTRKDFPKGYPIPLPANSGLGALEGYRIYRDGRLITPEPVKERYYLTEGAGSFSVEAVYATAVARSDGAPETVPVSCWNTCDITGIDVSAYPRVKVQVHTSIEGVTFSEFSLKENNNPMTLLSSCFTDNTTQYLDVVLVVDRSTCMNSYISTVAQTINCLADDVPSCVDLKFGLVFYGKNANGNSACGNMYTGSPYHENTSSLRTLSSAVTRLNEVAGYTLSGNQEPAYHAIQCALSSTPWRTGSQRVVILISDENSDHCTWNGSIPNISLSDLESRFSTVGAKFYAWCRTSVKCDCYDDCDSNRPPCSQWQYSGCTSGYEDFQPLAAYTGGTAISLCNSFWDVLEAIEVDYNCGGYELCYDAPCCVPGVDRTVTVTIDHGYDDCTTSETYHMDTCPPASAPVVVCAPTNPPIFIPGQPLTVCAIVTDADGDLSSVIAHYTAVRCDETVPAVHTGGNLWCVTVPGYYTSSATDIVVTFTASDSCDRTGTVTCTIPSDTCTIATGDFRTNTQDGWGQGTCYSNNVACVRNQYFGTVFPSGVTIGGTYTIRFTTSAAIGTYLPRGTSVGVLTQNYVNPTSTTTAGIFASQVLALKLNVAFGDAGVAGFHDLGPLQIASGPFIGYTVDQILSLANTVLGGNTGALPAGKSLGDLNTAVTQINSNFDDACHNNNFLIRICEEQHPPTVECWTGNPATFTYGQPLTMCVMASDPDNDITSVNYSYNTGPGCNSSGAATPVGGGRYCVTLPANCTQTTTLISVYFTVTDGANFVSRDTCYASVVCHPPTVLRWDQNPTFFTYGTPFTVCANVTDPDNDVTQVTASYLVGSCNTTVAATNTTGNRWCVTVPATCTRTCGPAMIIFRATDGCVLTGTDTVRIPSVSSPPNVTCWSGNPVTFSFGQPLTMCAFVTDADTNVISVTANYQIGGCNQTVNATLTSGRWCVTIPATCTRTCAPGLVIFTATDSCGYTDRDTCRVTGSNQPPVAACYTGNPPSYAWGQPLTICETVSDADNNLKSVLANYVIGTTNVTVAATLSSGRWCVTIPATATRTCQPGMVIFTAMDSCDAVDRDTCRFISSDLPPDVACWPGNPASFIYGQPLTMCATVTDVNLATVTANYQIGGFNQTVAATYTSGRWCVTVPATATRTCLPGIVVFTALDSCGYLDRDTCRVNSTNRPPDVACYTGNPATYAWGQPLTLCAMVADSDNNVRSVLANYVIGGCNQTVAATLTGGRWCVTIPATCTRSCAPGIVIFTAADSCGLADYDTCRVTGTNSPPVAACYTGNPTTYTWGVPLTICETVTDPDNNLRSVLANYVIGSCNQTVAAVYTGGRWCVTVPANCLQTCAAGMVIFTATDSCDAFDRDTCRFNSGDLPPVQICWPGNPTTYSWGQSFQMCVTVADANLATVTGRVVGCGTNLPATLSGGRWCITVPASCTRSCADLVIAFTATDSCGQTDRDTCRVQSIDGPPDQACWSGNPATFTYGQPLTMCVTVTDVNLATVTASVVGCTASIPVSRDSTSRWCAAIPASCTLTCSQLAVVFTATDSCGRIDRDTCRTNSVNQPPVAACYAGNPTTYVWGQPLTLCETVSDPNNNLKSVTANYILGSCNTTVAATLSSGRWCVTIPATCTQRCGAGMVVFTATDSCDASDRDTCRFNSSDTPPVQTCWPGNPTTYVFGQPLTMCATATDVNLASVTATVVGCAGSYPASNTSGRWCATIPATCTRICTPLCVVFTAQDSCGYISRDTCCVTSSNRPPMAVCWPGNPLTYTWGQSLTVCDSVIDPDNNLASVTANYIVGGCNATVPATFSGGRWCVTIPASCTHSCLPGMVIFTAADSCGLVDRDTCRFISNDAPPVQVLWPSNPTIYTWGLPLNLCVTVTDANLAAVSASVVGCTAAIPVSYTSGRWCATIPTACTATCSSLTVVFTAIDSCGGMDHDTAHVNSTNQPPVGTCYPGNPLNFVWGQPLIVCETVTDPDNNLSFVAANFIFGTCNQTERATLVSGRWCITIPAACTQSCVAGMVIFTAVDTCGLMDRDTCRVLAAPQTPVVTCWDQNPALYTYGAPLTMCAIVSDADSNVATVSASYTTGSCTTSLAASSVGGGRWCVTIPASCTLARQTITVIFRATDACGLTSADTCYSLILCDAPTLLCSPANPTQYDYGLPLTVCVDITDPEADVDSVGARYYGELCNSSASVTQSGGHWCVTVPAACTQSYQPIYVEVTARDRCNLTGTVTCMIPGCQSTAPTVSCWSGNPQMYTIGLPVTMCALVTDPDDDVIAVTARLIGDTCAPPLTVTPTGPDRWCVTIPASCTNTILPITIVFTATDNCQRQDTAVCVVEPPENLNTCCFLCITDPAFVTTSRMVDNVQRNPANLVIYMDEGSLKLHWDPIPDADYYLIFRSDLHSSLDEIAPVGFRQPEYTDWTELTYIEDLPRQAFYQVVACKVTMQTARTDGDRGQWEMNEGVGDTVYDASGNNRNAWRWPVCPPQWGSEVDTVCNDNFTEFMDFEGYVYTPSQCAEHLRVNNDDAFYQDRFQAWARIRIHEHPTISSGAYYIMSNHSLNVEGGGFGFRIDPGWVMRNGVREYHNRLTGLVYDEAYGTGSAGFRSLTSPSPTLTDTTTNSVPLDKWCCVTMIVDGNNSMLLIDGRVVAAGNLRYRTHNNGVPLIIGAGYRHNTHPIEYPFIGEMDCVRLTDLP